MPLTLAHIRQQFDHVDKNEYQTSSPNECRSEWLLFNTKWEIFQLYRGENKLQVHFRFLVGSVLLMFIVFCDVFLVVFVFVLCLILYPELSFLLRYDNSG